MVINIAGAVLGMARRISGVTSEPDQGPHRLEDFLMSAIAEAVEMTSQPLPDRVGIMNGKYLVGSNESILVFMTSSGEMRMIGMAVLQAICSTEAKSGQARNDEIYAASTSWSDCSN